jgi:hypothetical protein
VSFINPVRLFAGFYCWGQEYEVIPTRWLIVSRIGHCKCEWFVLHDVD